MRSSTCCSVCGALPSPDQPVHLWGMAVVSQERSFTCPPCVREELEFIESRRELVPC